MLFKCLCCLTLYAFSYICSMHMSDSKSKTRNQTSVKWPSFIITSLKVNNDIHTRSWATSVYQHNILMVQWMRPAVSNADSGRVTGLVNFCKEPWYAACRIWGAKWNGRG